MVHPPGPGLARLSGTLILAGSLVGLVFGHVASEADVGAHRTILPGFTVSVAASRATLHYPKQRSYTLTYAISTGNQPENVSIQEGSGSWPDREVAGSPWSYGPVRLLGPGQLLFGGGHFDYLPGTCIRGDVGAGAGFEVDLPANTSTSVVQRVDIAAPPWPGMSWTPKLSVSSAGSRVPVPLSSPHIAVSGSLGVHIRLRSTPGLPKRAFGFSYPVLPGQTLSISGTTDPMVAHSRIRLSALLYTNAIPQGHQVPLGSVLTDKHGHFHTRTWQLTVPGSYLVSAQYIHPRRGLVADSSCDLGGFDVRTRP